MKKLVFLMVLIVGTSAMAKERLILSDSKVIETNVDRKTVFCSRVGYGFEELKINIPALDGWTLLDHTNTRFSDKELLPCMTAGPCQTEIINGLSIDDVIQDNPRIEEITVERKVFEVKTLREKNCERSLREELSTLIGGVEFTHTRSSVLETLPAKSCQ